MEAIRRFAAIVLADLRERSRSPRFWIALVLVALATWQCFPSRESGLLSVSLGSDARGAYSSAWVGLTLALVNSTLLSLVGFYLVRGTLVRDFDTRVWQLLVATPMTRAGYLLAKWASHMAVFGLLLLAGLAVGLLAQWVRAEDRAIDLLELVKPTLVLALPSLAVTAFLAVLFDLTPWTRRTAGNVLYFFVWAGLLGGTAAALDSGPSAADGGWLSDPAGLVLVERDLARALSVSAPWVKVHGLSVSIAMGEPTAIRLFHWSHWSMSGADIAGRALWVLLPMIGVMLLARRLERAASHVRTSIAASTGGLRLRWLDYLLRPMDSFRASRLIAAELKLVLRQRRAWWWLVLAICWTVQLVGTREAMGGAMIIAWLASTDVFARALLREHDTRTAALVFTSAGASRNVLAARCFMAVTLAVSSVAPALLRLSAIDADSSLVVLLMAGNVALAGLASAALLDSSRPFELVLVVLAYAGLQGHGPLVVRTEPSVLTTQWLVLCLAIAALLANRTILATRRPWRELGSGRSTAGARGKRMRNAPGTEAALPVER